MGYAKQGQNTKGIHIRQFSRAFIFEQDGERNVYVSADCGMMGQLVKMKVSDFNLHIHKFSIVNQHLKMDFMLNLPIS